ncbi:acyl-CoA thioesterase [Paracoccus onubensis]|uniref:acyl-CoA thioesterase n=1 Tax=Paracoccus onubensis TaxID=1675788 RepID=UPI00272F52CD|nr:acyl-CoA thioesterase [Paracoccus onubensis]MDP0929769.1 acyl-CoA thioesterase [Paracoccus onubensis]
MDEKPYVTEIEIRYRDTDSMGHVSSPIYYDYLQSAYLEYMHDLLRLPKDRKLPHIMVRTSCEYVSQAIYGDRINVLSRVTRFGTKSFEMEHVMRLADDSAREVARAASVHVMFDYEAQKTYPVPDDFKSAVATYQGSA